MIHYQGLPPVLDQALPRVPAQVIIVDASPLLGKRTLDSPSNLIVTILFPLDRVQPTREATLPYSRDYLR
jgi:hypothetical protein